ASGRCLALWRRRAEADRSNRPAEVRNDSFPATNAVSIASRSRCRHTVHALGIRQTSYPPLYQLLQFGVTRRPRLRIERRMKRRGAGVIPDQNGASMVPEAVLTRLSSAKRSRASLSAATIVIVDGPRGPAVRYPEPFRVSAARRGLPGTSRDWAVPR